MGYPPATAATGLGLIATDRRPWRGSDIPIKPGAKIFAMQDLLLGKM
jgi:hypothetical protein